MIVFALIKNLSFMGLLEHIEYVTSSIMLTKKNTFSVFRRYFQIFGIKGSFFVNFLTMMINAQYLYSTAEANFFVHIQFAAKL